MNRLENKEKIDRIEMRPTACVKCAIGQDWYQCHFNVTFVPNEYYPDYMDVEQYIMEEIDGHELNIEEAVNKLFAFLKNIYEPKHLSVECDVRGCKVHFDVLVVKRDE